MSVRRALASLLVALPLSGCLSFDWDLDEVDDAAELAPGQPILNELDCDEGDGDCNDWYRLSVVESGTLELTLATVAGQGPGAELLLTLADAQQLTLAEGKSSGRARFSLRWPVEPGTHYVLVRAASTHGELGYQLSALTKPGEVLVDTGADNADPSAPRMCLRVEAHANANFYAGQPHVVRLAIYPLQSALGFDQAHVDDLLAGAKPPGAAGDAIVVKVVPGETRGLSDLLPPNTRSLGVVADYYRPPGVRGGPRKLSVSASCAGGETDLFLDETELELR